MEYYLAVKKKKKEWGSDIGYDIEPWQYYDKS